MRGRRGKQAESAQNLQARAIRRKKKTQNTREPPDRPCSEAVEQRHTWSTSSQGPERRGQGRAEELCADRKGGAAPRWEGGRRLSSCRS